MKVIKSCFLGGRGTSYSLVQTLLLWDVSFSHNTLRYRLTDRQTDDSLMPIADHTACSSTVRHSVRLSLEAIKFVYLGCYCVIQSLLLSSTYSVKVVTICDLPDVINCLFHVFSAAPSGLGLFPSPDLQFGTHCLMIYVIQL